MKILKSASCDVGVQDKNSINKPRKQQFFIPVIMGIVKNGFSLTIKVALISSSQNFQPLKI